MNVAAEHITQLDAACHYATRGLLVFPANPRTKAPLTENGMKDATLDVAQIRAWWTEHPDALIACRIAPEHVVLDTDPRHGGDSTWAELERAYSPIEPERSHTSGRGDGGAHHWFQHPGGKLSARKLHEWARANGVGQAAGQRSWTSGIDILHHDHRYSILPPSLHPETGKPYLWTARNQPGPMPGFLAALITIDPVTERPQLRPVHDAESIADWYTANTSWHDLLPRQGWVLVSGDGDSDGSKWRHPNASAESSASVRHGCLFVYSTNTDFDVTEDGDPHGITRFRAWATLEHGGDLSEAARAAYRQRHGDTPAPIALQDLIAPPAATPPPSTINLPDEFWASRPELQHIRQAAHARARSADAVLLFTLARIAALTHPSIHLPAIVGSAGSLNFLGGVVASSGAGKTTAGAVARELVPIDRTDISADVPLGSGEGLVELFFDWVNEEQSDGKTKKVKRQTKTGAYVYLDEGQALSEMGNRKGATLMPTLRNAWSGDTLGQSNASQETHRVLKPHSYRLAVMVGFQLEYAADVIAEGVSGGTPQRFVFASAVDPNVPLEGPEWPGPLEIQLPAVILTGTCIDVDRDIATDLRTRNVLTTQGQLQIDPLDSHRDFVTLRIAALLAILNARLDVTKTDWALALDVMNRSVAIRTWILETANQRAARTEQGRIVQAVRRQAALEDDATERAIKAGAKTIAKRLHKTEMGSRRDLLSALSSKQRTAASFDDMIAYAVQQGWIVEVADGWRASESRPT